MRVTRRPRRYVAAIPQLCGHGTHELSESDVEPVASHLPGQRLHQRRVEPDECVRTFQHEIPELAFVCRIGNPTVERERIGNPIVRQSLEIYERNIQSTRQSPGQRGLACTAGAGKRHTAHYAPVGTAPR